MPHHPSSPSPPALSDLRIRQARAADVDGLVRLEEAAFSGDRLDRRSFARLARSRSAILLTARAGAALAGYVLVLTRRGSATARLYSLAVASEAAGRGIGLRLLLAAEAAARSRGARVLRLEVRSDNVAAIALYGRHGYERIGERPGYYEDGADAFRYQRRLRPLRQRTKRAAARGAEGPGLPV